MATQLSQVAPYRPNAFFFFLRAILVVSLIAGFLLTVSAFITFISFLENVVPPPGLLLDALMAFTYGAAAPFWIPFTFIMGLIGTIVAHRARTLSGDIAEEKKYIRLTSMVGRYNLVFAGLLLVCTFSLSAFVLPSLLHD